MIVFRKDDGPLIGTSYKVMSSTLIRLGYRQVRGEPVDFMLVRHPLRRAVSAFRDKCRLNLSSDRPQHSQEALLHAWGRNGDPVEVLQEMSFETYVELLPRLVWLEPHFWAQLHGMRLRSSGRYVRIESELALVGLDQAPKANDTGAVVIDATLMQQQRIRDVYLADYKRFGYEHPIDLDDPTDN